MRLDNEIERAVRAPFFSLQLATHQSFAPCDLQLYERIHTIALQRQMQAMPSLGRFDVKGASPDFDSIGRLMLVPAETPLSIRAGASKSRTVRCCFRPQHLEEIMGETVTFEPDRLHRCLDLRIPRVRDLLVQIGDELEAPGFAHDARVEASGYDLIAEVVQHVRHAPRYSAFKRGGLSDRVFSRILERIEDDARPPFLSELAELAGLSVRHLTRAFTERTGFSVHAFIERRRFDKAAQLLRATDMPIAEISQQLAFRSPAYFSTAFKKYAGIAPRAYRRCFSL
jgi:AraC family transcriptional regulator